MHNNSKGINALVVNVHSSMNAGDAALLELSLAIIKKSFGEVSFTLCANWPSESYFVDGSHEVIPSAWSLAGIDGRLPIFQQISAILRGWSWARRYARGKQKGVTEDWHRLFKAYQQADLVVGVCGNQFFSTGRYGWPFPAKLLAVALADIFHKPYYALPQTIGPLKRGWERYAFSQVYSKARLVFVRDQASLDLGKRLSLPDAKLHYAPDPGLFFKPGNIDEAKRILNGHKRSWQAPALGVSVINQIGRFIDETRLEAYYDALSRAIIEFQKHHGGSVFLFNQVRGPTRMEDDRIASQEIIKRTQGLSQDIVIVEDAQTPAQLKACYGLMDVFIATRLHAGLFSIGAGTPTMFIGYLTKTRGVLSSLGMEDLVVDLEDLNQADLYQKLDAIWVHRKYYKKKLARVVDEQRRLLDRCERLIKIDYDAYAS